MARTVWMPAAFAVIHRIRLSISLVRAVMAWPIPVPWMTFAVFAMVSVGIRDDECHDH